MHGACDLVMCLGDLDGHVGRYFDGVHGWYGVGHRNLEGRVLSGEGIMCVRYMV